MLAAKVSVMNRLPPESIVIPEGPYFGPGAELIIAGSLRFTNLAKVAVPSESTLKAPTDQCILR